MGTFFKQIYRYTRPRRYRHNENLWPYVRITRANEGHIESLRFRGHPVPIVNLSSLKDKYSGDLLVVASGPSVNEIDFTPLKKLPAMGVNGSWYLRDKTSFNLFMIVDMTFIDQRPNMVNEVISDQNIMFFTTVNCLVKIIKQFGLSALRCQIAIIEDACYKIFKPQILPDEIHQHYQHEKDISFSEADKNIAFSHDIRKGVFDAATVAYWALQVIHFMGFNRLMIAGLDMNNFQRPRFYENEHDISPSFLEDKFTGLIEPAFSHASKAFKEKNIEVLNLSLQSRLDSSVFKKVSSNDIQQK